MGPEKLWPDPEPDNSFLERCLREKGYQRVGGLDEAGRGPLAGPVVAAAVILDPLQPVAGLDDSKKLSEARRETLFPQIRKQSLAWAVVGEKAGFATICDYNPSDGGVHKYLQFCVHITSVSCGPEGAFI